MQDEEDNAILAEYKLVHNIIYGAVEYAEELGFAPHKDFSATRYILEEDDDNIELINIEFGFNGKPAVVIGPFDNPEKIIATLNRTVGKGNYTIIDSADDIEYDEEYDDEKNKP